MYIIFFLQLLAGAQVNDLTPQRQTALHIAAAHDHSSLLQVLLENHIDYDAVDNNQNNGNSFMNHNIVMFILIKVLGIPSFFIVLKYI